MQGFKALIVGLLILTKDLSAQSISVSMESGQRWADLSQPEKSQAEMALKALIGVHRYAQVGLQFLRFKSFDLGMVHEWGLDSRLLSPFLGRFRLILGWEKGLYALSPGNSANKLSNKTSRVLGGLSFHALPHADWTLSVHREARGTQADHWGLSSGVEIIL